jgi:hypothetical protein
MKKMIIAALGAILIFESCKSRTGLETTESRQTLNYLQTISVLRYDTLDQVREPWDADSSGPELNASIFKATATQALYTTPVQINTKPKNLPVEWQTPEILLSNSQWRLVLYDNDDGYEQEMAQFTFNGNDADSDIVLKNPKGFEVKLTVDKKAE